MLDMTEDADGQSSFRGLMRKMKSKSNTLHCTLVWEKTILDERIYPKSAKIMIGESAWNTFSIRSSTCEKRHCLFRHHAKGTVLALKSGMRGKIRIAGQVKEIDALTHPEAVAGRKGTDIFYDLSEGDEGILVFGKTGLVFRIDAEQAQPNKAGFREIVDYNPMLFRFFLATLIFMLASSVLTRLIAHPREAITVEHLPERMVSMVIQDPEAADAFRRELKRIKKKKKQSKNAPLYQKTKASTRKKSNHKPSLPPSKKTREGMLGALVEARDRPGALRDVLKNSGLETDLSKAIQNLDRGMANANVIMSSGRGGGLLLPTFPIQNKTRSPRSIDSNTPSTGTTGRKLGNQTQLTKRAEIKVRVSIPPSAAKTTGGNLSKQEIFEVVQRNQGAIRYCYESQLNRYPTLRGDLTADFIINVTGEVNKVTIPHNRLTPKIARDKVAECLIRFISRWRFPKPSGGKVRVVYPFRFGYIK